MKPEPTAAAQTPTSGAESLPTFSARREVLADGSIHLEVGGEIDMATAPELEFALFEALHSGAAVRLDLAAVEFMDSTGLTVLVRTLNEAKLRGWDLTVARTLTQQVRHLMELTLVDEMVPFAAD